MKVLASIGLFVLLFLPPGVTAEKHGIEAGEAIADFSFTDIQGVDGSLVEYKDWIQVFTFADRGSSDPLMAWMGPAGMEAIRRHPEVRFARINFADVTAVPSMFAGMVGRILRRIDSDATEELLENYRKADVPFRADLNVFHMIPDWDGKYLDHFGLKDAEQWHTWIAVGGVVIVHIRQDETDPMQRFVEAIDRAVRKGVSGPIQ